MPSSTEPSFGCNPLQATQRHSIQTLGYVAAPCVENLARTSTRKRHSWRHGRCWQPEAACQGAAFPPPGLPPAAPPQTTSPGRTPGGNVSAGTLAPDLLRPWAQKRALLRPSLSQLLYAHLRPLPASFLPGAPFSRPDLPSPARRGFRSPNENLKGTPPIKHGGRAYSGLLFCAGLPCLRRSYRGPCFFQQTPHVVDLEGMQ